MQNIFLSAVEGSFHVLCLRVIFLMNISFIYNIQIQIFIIHSHNTYIHTYDEYKPYLTIRLLRQLHITTKTVNII